MRYSAFASVTASPILTIYLTTNEGPDVITFRPQAQTYQTMLTGTWQEWDALNASGKWDSQIPICNSKSFSQYINCVANFNPVVTDATFDGGNGLRFQAGVGTDGNVDKFIIGISGSDTTYDFEPTTASNNYARQFYSDNNFTNPVGSPTNGITNPLKNNWGMGSPAPGVPADNFSARYQGTFDFTANKYTFTAQTFGKLKVTIDMDNDWNTTGDQAVIFDKTTTGAVAGAKLMTAGIHSVKVDYVNITGRAGFNLAIYAQPSSVFPFTGNCFDFNGDGLVNVGDQSFQSSAYGLTGAVNTIAFDVNNDGVVNAGDQAIVANKYGKACPY